MANPQNTKPAANATTNATPGTCVDAKCAQKHKVTYRFVITSKPDLNMPYAVAIGGAVDPAFKDRAFGVACKNGKIEFYAESGKLLKTAYYRRYQPIFGVQRPTEMVIIDGLESDWVTVMRYSDWTSREVPEAWLQRDYLPRFKPE